MEFEEIIGYGTFNKANKEYFSLATNPAKYKEREFFRLKLREYNYHKKVLSKALTPLIVFPVDINFDKETEEYVIKFKKIELIKIYLGLTNQKMRTNKKELARFVNTTKKELAKKILDERRKQK